MYLSVLKSILDKRRFIINKLSYTRAREIIREDLSSIGINTNNYGLHSLRSGGASAAYKHGCKKV
jgi:hypothetical protein